ncbi:Kup system potassium uptake protein [Minicystis rosea]|nr:Kup system potassium uptake protein [Minicystis rosea]
MSSQSTGATAGPSGASASGTRDHGHAGGWKLALAALGVVYGDIGTSPLYTLKECLHGEHALGVSQANVFGILSLIFWSLTFVVTIKYLAFILRADNHGEGGILALLALIPEDKDKEKKRVGPGLLVLLVVFGAALLYGDGVITPAISVLSAMEGLEVATPTLKPVIVPMTVAILFGLFVVQKHGTTGIGRVFGPVMLLWFTMLGALGLRQIVAAPGILMAVNPAHAVSFFVHNRGLGFLVLGSVVLSITGAEALYADMGHFGRTPIRRSWFMLVFPALLASYFGQGAHLLAHPATVDNPFYAIVPAPLLYPAVAVATAATVVASQALISGAFSLTQQAVQLGFFPRVTIVHTSKHTEGQIYIPEINNMLLVACIGLVLAFRSSSALAAAYGIAVTGTMSITTIVYYVVCTRTWGWPAWKAMPLAGLFLVVDLAFFGSTAVKLPDGGWFPILMAAGIFTVMTTWQTGRRYLGEMMASSMMPLDLFLEDLCNTKPTRVRGTAVFMASNPNGVPVILLHHFKHNQVLHDQVVLLTVLGLHVPEVPPERRVKVDDLGHGFFRVTVLYGFMQTPDIPKALRDCAAHGLVMVPERTSYYLGRETLLPSGKTRMARWRKQLFAFVSRNARPATAYFGLPPNRVVELGMQVDL